MNLTEAFKALNALNEDTFSVDDDGIQKLSAFENDDDLSDDIAVIDPEAETADDIQDSYVGKVILDCGVCHSKIYKDKSEVELNDDQTLANVGEECPYCYTSDGFKVIGEVAEFDGEDTDEEADDEDIEEAVDLKTCPVCGRKFSESELKDGRCPKCKEILQKTDSGEYVKADMDTDKKESMNEGIFDMFKKKKKAPASSSTNKKTSGSDSNASYNRFVKAIPYKGSEISVMSNGKSVKYVPDTNGTHYDTVEEARANIDFFKSGRSRSYESVENVESFESLEESVNAINVETDDETISFSTDENGNVTMSTSPVGVEGGDEMLAPLSDETQAEIEGNGEEMPAEGEEMPAEGEGEESVSMEEFDEEAFDDLGESYLRNIYENVTSYKTTSVRSKGNKLTVEGLIKFNSGNTKKTSFIFEAQDITKSGKLRFIGENANITRGKKAFAVRGIVEGNKFIAESLNYNYKQKDESGKSTRIYGTVKTQKRG